MGDYLVTGAAGFIGAAIARRLIDEGHRVWTIDNLSTGFEGNIPSGVVFVRGDCQDPAVIARLNGTRFDAIVHMAGQSSGEVSFDNPVYDLRTNTESTLLLIRYGLETGSRRFVYASSMSVYGAVDDRPISENRKPVPLSFYGVGKLASEHYLRIYAERGLEPTALRFFNVYGPGQNMANLRQGMVSIFLEMLLAGGHIRVKGDLDRFRDFIYVDDCVEAVLSAIRRPEAVGGIYNIGTGVRTTVRQLIDHLLSISGIEGKVSVLDGTPGDQRGIYADIYLARREIGFIPGYDLQTGLERMIVWAKENR